MATQVHGEEATRERIAQLELRVDNLARSVLEMGRRLSELEMLREAVGNLKFEVEEMREE